MVIEMLNLKLSNKKLYQSVIEETLADLFYLNAAVIGYPDNLVHQADNNWDFIEQPLEIPSNYSEKVNHICPFCCDMEKLYISDLKPLALIKDEVNHLLNHFNTNDEFYLSEYIRKKYKFMDNKIIICGKCLKHKRGEYPTDKTGKPLFVNPLSSRTKVKSHFKYNNGEIKGVSRKGSTSVELFGLNRLELINSRKLIYKKWLSDEINFAIEDLLDDISNIQIEYLRYLLLNDKVFYKKSIAKFGSIETRSIMDRLDRSDAPKIVTRKKPQPYKIEKYEIFSDKITHYLDSNDNKVSDYVETNMFLDEKSFMQRKKLFEKSLLELSNSRYNKKEQSIKPFFIQNILIREFKMIKNLEINLVKNQDLGSWLTIIGENGSGKTTILKAIAATLVNQNHRNLYVNTEKKNRVEIVSDMNYLFSINEDLPEYPLVIAYGAVRLKDGINAEKNEYSSSIGNLFESRKGLANPEEFLMDISREDFYTVTQIVRKAFPEKIEIDRDERQIFFMGTNWKASYSELSEGYGVIVSLLIDIMSKIKNHYNHYDGQAIVLIDEIENHLHPKWIIKLPRLLKRLFPYVQFITTTHNPLILRELQAHEVFQLKKIDENLIIESAENDPSNFSMDSLLESSLFGMESTNPKKDREIRELYEKVYKKKKKEPIDSDITEQDYLNKLRSIYSSIQNSENIENFRYFLKMYLEKDFEKNSLSVKERIEQCVNKIISKGKDDE